MSNLFLCIACVTIAGLHNTFAFPYAPKEPLAATNNGVVRGSYMTARCGRPFRAFRGIPFAKPPVGDLRFKNPEPPDNWEFPLDTTKDGPFCIQKDYFFKNPKVEGSEDCLYLNVYTPQMESYHDSYVVNNLLPVMVFIHWGGFLAGRGTSDYQGPEYFMDQDVILVTFNYRLGILGFLTTLDDNSPGNYGLKDQVAALKWVQQNIANFGGDPGRVTLFGQSAGGGSVHLHMLSPSSKGLFSAAISQSGAALSLWAKPTNIIQPNITAAQALFVGCGENIGQNDKLIKCLRGVDAATLVDSSEKFKYFDVEPLTVFGIVTEVQTKANPEPFITKEPLEYIQNGEFLQIPWIIGTAQDEGILRAAPLLRQRKLRETLNSNFTILFPQIMLLSLSVGPDTESLFKNMTDFYLGGQYAVNVDEPASVQGFTDIYTDRSFKYGSYQSVMLHSAKGHKPVWFYNFDYRGQHSYGDLFAATDEQINFQWGVSHCDDLLYLFSSPALFPSLTHPSDIAVSFGMIEMWTNFAKNGAPWNLQDIKFEDDPDSFRWNQVNVDENMRNEDLYYLNITGSYYNLNSIGYNFQNGYHKERMSFWASQKLAENFPGLN